MVPFIQIPEELVANVYLKPWSVIHNEEAKKGSEVKSKFLVILDISIISGEALCIGGTRGLKRALEGKKYVARLKEGSSKFFNKNTYFDLKNDTVRYSVKDFTEWLNNDKLKYLGILENEHHGTILKAAENAYPKNIHTKDAVISFAKKKTR